MTMSNDQNQTETQDSGAIIEAPAITAKELKRRAARYVQVCGYITRLDARRKDFVAEKEQYEREAHLDFTACEIPAIELTDGRGVRRRVAPKSTIWASLVDGNKPDERVVKILEGAGLGDLVNPSVDTKQLSASVRERVRVALKTTNVSEQEIRDVLGSELADQLKLTIKPGISLTSKSKK